MVIKRAEGESIDYVAHRTLYKDCRKMTAVGQKVFEYFWKHVKEYTFS